VRLLEVDGLELTRRLKADPRRRDIIVIAPTAHAMKATKKGRAPPAPTPTCPKRIDTPTLSAVIASYRERVPGIQYQNRTVQPRRQYDALCFPSGHWHVT
jgi:CheY-like chemotaxis protein